MNTLNGIALQDIFTAAHVEKLGATQAEFNADPVGTLERIGQADAPAIMEKGFRPLLPAQVRLRQEAIQQWKREGTWDDQSGSTGVRNMGREHAAEPTMTLAA